MRVVRGPFGSRESRMTRYLLAPTSKPRMFAVHLAAAAVTCGVALGVFAIVALCVLLAGCAPIPCQEGTKILRDADAWMNCYNGSRLVTEQHKTYVLAKCVCAPVAGVKP